MTLFRIVRCNMRQRLLATLLTTLMVALGVSLTVAILLIRKGMENRFAASTMGFDMVVGAKGSPLQLVLNTVFNLDVSPGNISWNRFLELRDDKRVKLAIPFSVGDNYKGFRIVGTTDAFFKDFDFGREDKKFELADGRIFQFAEENLKAAFKEAAERARERIAAEKGAAAPKKNKNIPPFKKVAEAVIGSTVAHDTGLKTGDSFIAAHGVVESPEAELHKENPWKVVGVLEPTHTACDRSIYINLDSFYQIEGHEVREKPGEKPGEGKESDPDAGQISSIVLKLRSPIYLPSMMSQINDREDTLAAWPFGEIQKLFSYIGNIDQILLAQAVLVVLVAAIGIAVSIYNSMSERRREIAIMRALGARRSAIFSIVVIEATVICALGGLMGMLAGHGVVAVANPFLQQVSGFSVEPFQIQPIEPLVWGGCIFLGALCGLGPAIRAYKTPVAENLAPIS